MDNRGICSLKDKKKMDSSTVWQWRVMRVMEYSRCAEPFHHSSKIGLDFNVASNTQKKLDLQLLTNGVILEVCDFAKTVNKSKRHFITNILENNFDLGLESEQQRVAFTARILHKVKDLIRKPPEDKQEAFTLFDSSAKPECTSYSNNGLNMVSTEHKTEGVAVEMNDTDDSKHEDKFKSSQATNQKSTETERLLEEMDGASSDDSEHEDEFLCSGAESTQELKDVVPPSFPSCEEIGLKLDIGSKQSLDPGLLTKGVMLELVHFTKVLTASYSRIILDVLEHNFELDLKNQQVKNRVWFKISHLLKRRKQLGATGGKTTARFKNEPFSFQTNPFTRHRGSALGAPEYQLKEVTKRRQSDLKNKQEKRTTSEQISKRYRKGQPKHLETNTFSHGKAEDDHDYTCPLEESDLESDSGNAGNRDHSENPTHSDIPKESESCCLGTHETFLTTSDVSSTLTGFSSNVKPPFPSQLDKKGLQGGDEQTQTRRNALKECDLEQEEMGSQNNMWKLRANRVEQILSALNKEFGPFIRSRKAGLKYDVGFGPKQNISVHSLTNPLLLEIAKFALAINSSQEYFIMEILEYNFDLGLQSQHQRDIFTCEVMNRIRHLRSCEDAVKFSKEVFELPGQNPSTANQSVDDDVPGFSSACGFAPMCPPDSHAESEKHISCKTAGLYPLCEEIGLKLHVSNSQPNKKLENKLTNGAVTEVTDFAEKLCGTFEQICLDILQHNFDFDLQSGDSDLARSIVARIPVAMQTRNLSSCVKAYKTKKRTGKDGSTKDEMDCQDKPNFNACSAGSSQAAITDQNVDSSANNDHKNELSLKLWKLRANHIKHILSMPHQDHCPLYSYSRCKKLGIDFNVGSGVKQNLDPRLLTNGVMVELNTFATALLSARMYFITEILEYNFHLSFDNELSRSTFAKQTLEKIVAMNTYKRHSTHRLRRPFELLDVRCIEEPTCTKITYCPKCYQDRSHKLQQDESDTGHMHHPRPYTMTDSVSADANCTAQKSAKDPSCTSPTVEETIMDTYPCCKKIGLSLCVDKDRPKDKLDRHVLTRAIMNEVLKFAKKLCGTKNKVINDILEHNFNIGMQIQDLHHEQVFRRAASNNDGSLRWFDEVFAIQPCPPKQTDCVSKLKQTSALERSEWKDIIKKRKLALQGKEKATSMSQYRSVKKPKTNLGGIGRLYPNCMKIGLDLDVTSKSGHKEKLDLKLLTTAVVVEIHKFASQKIGHYFPGTVFDILDYNFDLSTKHNRRWEFSIAAASKVQSTVKRYRRKQVRPDKVFELPVVFGRNHSQMFLEKRQKMECKKSSQEEPENKWNKGRFVHRVRYRTDVNRIVFVSCVKSNEESSSHDEDTNFPRDLWTMNVQRNGSICSGSPLQGHIQFKEEEIDPHYGDMNPEPDPEEKCHPRDDVKTKSNIGYGVHLVPGGPDGSLGYTMCSNSDSNIKTESENEGVQYYIVDEPPGSEGRVVIAICANTANNIKTEADPVDIKCLVPAEVAAPLGYSMITIEQGNESALVKEEQENMPADSYLHGVVSYSEGEVGIKQE